MTLVMLAMFSVTLLGCDDDDPTAPDPFEDPVDPVGTWTFNILVTEANGICDGEVGVASNEVITIATMDTEQPFDVSASGFLGVPTNILTGTFDNNILTISGSYPEEDGTTTATHTLVATSANQMVGIETWNFQNTEGSCPGSMSAVTASRINL
jgi:hypothetical protein